VRIRGPRGDIRSPSDHTTTISRPLVTNMKRLFFLCFLLGLTMPVMTGCGGSGETVVNEETDADKEANDQYEREMAEFEKSGGYGN